MNQFACNLRKRLNSIILRTSKERKRFVCLPDKDFIRKGKLPLQTLIKLILSLGSGRLGGELLNFFSIGPQTPSVSAFVQQRAKLLPDAFEHIFHEFTRKLPCLRLKDGYRLLAVDGCQLCSVANPNEPENYFKTFPCKKGFNLHNLNALYDICNRIYVDALIYAGKKNHICGALNKMVDRSEIKGKVILLADRAYASYNVFEHITRKGWRYIIRAQDLPSCRSMISSMSFPPTGPVDRWLHLNVTRRNTKATTTQRDIYRYIPSTGPFDFLPPGSKEDYPIHLRVVRLEILPGVYELLVTNLNEKEFPPEKLKELYHLRWGIETSFRELKYTIGVLSFHSKLDNSIRQEIFAGLTMYNFCEAITTQAILMLEAEKIMKKRRRAGKHVYQVNFTMAIDICRFYFNKKEANRISSQDVLKEIGKHTEPVREGRALPRKRQQRTIISFLYRMN